MPRPHHRTISKRAVHALPADGSDALYWDRDLPGFGVRVYPSGRKSYVVQCRGPNGSQRVTIGRHGKITADEARKQAAAIIDRIKRGEDPVPAPARPEPTVVDLAERFMRAHVEVNCKPATATFYSLALDNHILPALGAMAVRAVEPANVSPLHYALRTRPVTANRVIDILSKMLSLAEAWDLRPAGSNPCRTVRRYKERKRERFLSPDETRRLGEVLDRAEAEGGASVYAVAAIRLLMLTGCRRNEVLSLRWDDVDRTAGELRIRDGKTGPRSVPLTPTVREVLAAIPRVPGNPWLIVSSRPGVQRLSTIREHWYRLRSQAGLDDVRIHDFRHSYASRALALGVSLTMIGRLLGHTKVSTTARYAHLARETERASAARVGGSIGAHVLALSVTTPSPVRQRASTG